MNERSAQGDSVASVYSPQCGLRRSGTNVPIPTIGDSLFLPQTDPVRTSLAAELLSEAISIPETHEDCVDRWLARVERDPVGDPLLLLERGMEVLWDWITPTLGVGTLSAIVERVRFTVVEKYPALNAVTVSERGVKVGALPSTGSRPDHTRDGVRSFLIEFLSVLGNLTAELLTPALHAALSDAKVSFEGQAHRRQEPRS